MTTKRQSFQQGSVLRRPRSKGPDVWVFFYRENGKQKTQVIGSIEKFPTKASAEMEVHELRKSINSRRECVYMGGVLDRYLAEDLPSRHITAASYKSHIKRIRERFGTMRVDEMVKNLMAIEQWLNSQMTEPRPSRPEQLLSKKSRLNLKACLHRIFERAMFWGLMDLQRNPIGLVTVKGKSKRTRPLVLVPVESYLKMLDDPLLPDHAKMMVMVAMCLGFRASEILGLQWSDVSFGLHGMEAIVRVQRSMVGKHEEDTKTPESTQDVPIHPELAIALEGWKTKAAPNCKWVFGNPLTGRPYHRESLLKDHIEPAAARAGIPGIGWHSFRHTYRTMLRELELPMEVQQKMMRHSDIKTTMGYGDQKLARERRPANDKIFEMIRRAG